MGHFSKDEPLIPRATRNRRMDKVYVGKGYYNQPVYRAKGGKTPRKPVKLLFGGQPGSSTTTSHQATTQPGWAESNVKSAMDAARRYAEQPFTPYDKQRFADFTEDQTSGFQGVRDTQGVAKPYFEKATTSLNEASAINPLQTAQPALDKAGASATGMDVAQPYLDTAGQTWPGASAEYMNPYIDQVVNRIATLGNRNLMEKILPGVNDTFTGGGTAQFGRERHADITGRAIRDTTEGIAAAQGNALAQGWKDNASIFATDAARAAGVAGTAGNLANADIQTQAGLARTGADIANVAKTGDISQATAEANLGTGIQGSQYRDANALVTSGDIQQQQAQKQKDFEREEFMREQYGDPAAKIGLQTQTLSGLGARVPTSVDTTSTTTTTAPQGSIAGQILGAGISLAGLAAPGAGGAPSALGNIAQTVKGLFAEGGPVGHFAAGGHAPMVRAMRAAAPQPRMAQPMRGMQPPPQLPPGVAAPVMRARGGYYSGGELSPTERTEAMDRTMLYRPRPWMEDVPQARAAREAMERAALIRRANAERVHAPRWVRDDAAEFVGDPVRWSERRSPGYEADRTRQFLRGAFSKAAGTMGAGLGVPHRLVDDTIDRVMPARYTTSDDTRGWGEMATDPLNYIPLAGVGKVLMRIPKAAGRMSPGTVATLPTGGDGYFGTYTDAQDLPGADGGPINAWAGSYPGYRSPQTGITYARGGYFPKGRC